MERHVQKSNACHSGRRRALSTLHHPRNQPFSLQPVKRLLHFDVFKSHTRSSTNWLHYWTVMLHQLRKVMWVAMKTINLITRNMLTSPVLLSILTFRGAPRLSAVSEIKTRKKTDLNNFINVIKRSGQVRSGFGTETWSSHLRCFRG